MGVSASLALRSVVLLAPLILFACGFAIPEATPAAPGEVALDAQEELTKSKSKVTDDWDGFQPRVCNHPEWSGAAQKPGADILGVKPGMPEAEVIERLRCVNPKLYITEATYQLQRNERAITARVADYKCNRLVQRKDLKGRDQVELVPVRGIECPIGVRLHPDKSSGS